MVTAVQAAIGTYAPLIKSIMEESEKTGDKGLVELAKIQKLCLEVDLAYPDDVKPSESGVHPQNRHRTGLDTVDMHGLLDSFVDDTFSYLLCNNHACFEKCTVQKELRDEQEKFNVHLHMESDGYLPDVPTENLNKLYIAGAHSTSAIRAVHYRAKALNEAYAGTDGRLSRDILLQLQPTLEEPLTRGTPATVYRQELEVAIPELPGFLSECANVGSGAAKVETLTQTMFNVSRRADMLSKQGKTIDTAVLGKQIEKHRPWLAGEGKGIVEFATTYFLSSHSMLKESDAFAKSLKTRRLVPATQLTLLVGAKLLSYARIVQGCYKLLLACPHGFCTRGSADIFTSSDILAFTSVSTKPLVVQADTTMKQAREYLDEFAETPAVVQLYGWLQIRLILLILKKKGKDIVLFKDVKAIEDKFYKDCQGHSLDLRSMPFAKPAEDEPPIPGTQPTITLNTAITFDDSGNVEKEALKAKGFDVGVQVLELQSKEKFTITEIVEGAVKINAVDGHLKMTVKDTELLDNFKPIKGERRVIHDGNFSAKLSQHPDILFDQKKSALKLGMSGSWNEHVAGLDGVQVQTEPKKMVLSKQDFETGGLRLVGLTANIGSTTEDKIPPSAADVEDSYKHSHSGKTHKLYATPMLGNFADDDKVAVLIPYWYVRDTQDGQMANMVKCTETRKVVCGDSVWDVKVPVLKNIKPLHSNDELLYYAKQAAAKAGKGSASRSTGVDKKGDKGSGPGGKKGGKKGTAAEKPALQSGSPKKKSKTGK